MAIRLQSNASATIPFISHDQAGTAIPVPAFVALPPGILSVYPTPDGTGVIVTPIATSGTAKITAPGRTGEVDIELVEPGTIVAVTFSEASAKFYAAAR